MSVRVELTNRTLVPTCSKEKSWALQWPDTAPGSEALLECPRRFVGPKVSRLCSMKDATTPEWLMPDFSNCLYEPLLRPYDRVSLLISMIEFSYIRDNSFSFNLSLSLFVVSKLDTGLSKHNRLGNDPCFLERITITRIVALSERSWSYLKHTRWNRTLPTYHRSIRFASLCRSSDAYRESHIEREKFHFKSASKNFNDYSYYYHCIPMYHV